MRWILFTLSCCLAGFIIGSHIAEEKLEDLQDCVSKHSEKECSKKFNWHSRIPLKD